MRKQRPVFFLSYLEREATPVHDGGNKRRVVPCTVQFSSVSGIFTLSADFMHACVPSYPLQGQHGGGTKFMSTKRDLELVNPCSTVPSFYRIKMEP